MPQDDVPSQPPTSMRETRIMSMPEGRERYIPVEDEDPNHMALVQYHPFMAVVRELASSQMNPTRALGEKLQACMVQNGQEVIGAMVARQLENERYLTDFAQSYDAVMEEQRLQNEAVARRMADQVAGDGFMAGAAESED